MDISGSYTLNAPREQVWDALLDPDLLKRAIPGCESLEPTGDNQYAMRLNVDVVGVKGAYQGTMRILDAQKPESYRVVVDGAGARGILHSDGVLRLQANNAGATDIHYSGQAQLGGAVASIGAQVARGAASMLLKRYFGRIASLLPAMAAVPAPASAASVAPVAVPDAPPAPSVPEPPAETPPVAVAAPIEPPPTSAPADIDVPPVAAPVETTYTPAPAAAKPEPYASPPPAAPVVESPPPASPTPPVVSATSSAMPARAPLSVSSIESQRSSAGSIGVIVAVLAVVIVVIVVLVVVGAFR
jgi:uncharacterized protein